MPERLILITTQPKYCDSLVEIARSAGVDDFVILSSPSGNDLVQLQLLAPEIDQQLLLDKLEAKLVDSEGWRITSLPVAATIPNIDLSEEQLAERLQRRTTQSRDELYNDVADGAELNGRYFMFILLSSVVTIVGLAQNNVAVVIGGMLIAPLLGPNLAFALGVALGDYKLMQRAALANLSGVAAILLISIPVGMIWTSAMQSPQLLERTNVGLEGIAIALAAGAAASLALSFGQPATLVGVMVAVALLPPSATLGMTIGAGEWHLATGAVSLLLVNVVCINLAAQGVFVARGVTPRTWFEKKKARRAIIVNAALWILMLSALIGLLVYHGPWTVRAT